MQSWQRIVVPILLAAIAGCGGASGGSDYTPTTPQTPTPTGSNPPVTTSTVTIADLTFSPATVSVPVGATVTWNWACSDGGSDGYGGYATCASHNVTFDDGSGVASSTQSSGSFSRTFAAAGTFKYHCSIHGAGIMSGSVVVQ
jgi:plastocyanin